MADSTLTYDKVKSHYSSLAREKEGENAGHIKKVALSFGYNAEDLAGIPEGANLGVSCGNPLAIAGLKPGETVIDLGSGAGFDVFQAARKIKPDGLSIGVDMSEDMLDRARRNATKASITNVKFVLSPITEIPLESSSADCVISNCVINLVPQAEKHLVFSEVYRLLKTGGRFAVSDILAKQEFSLEMQRDMGLYVGCISGASMIEEYETWLKEAGFKDIVIVDKQSDLNVYKERSQGNTASSCCAPISGTPATTKAATSSCCSTSCCSTGAPESTTASPCCEPPTSIKEESSTATPSYCCDKSKAAAEAESLKRVADLDFNEWVGSFSIYGTK